MGFRAAQVDALADDARLITVLTPRVVRLSTPQGSWMVRRSDTGVWEVSGEPAGPVLAGICEDATA